jgi:hypothetical protein
MKSKTLATLAVFSLVASMLAFSTGAAEAKKAKGPTSLAKDDVGDWGCNQDCTLAPMGDVVGQDLVEAQLGMADATTVNFIIKLNALPPSGGVPEFSRYTWEFSVDGNAMQLSGGFTEYIRGICNPTYNPMICPPPRDPGMAPFFLRVGGCTVGGPCEEKALLHATFDAAAGTITIPVPLEVIEAKPGSKIGPLGSLFGGTIYAAPAAMVTNASVPADTMTITKIWTVPKK